MEAFKEAQIQAQLSGLSFGGMSASSAIRANQLGEKAEKLLSLDEPLEVAVGNEALPPEAEDPREDEFYGIRETLKSGADFINLDASNERMKLAADLTCLDMALDAAQSIDAKNSLEKMLMHQAAACHSMSMHLLCRANEKGHNSYGRLDAESKNIEHQVKLINASARLMDVYNRALLTFQKLRSGGRQLVTVQHVKVSGKAQAIVAGSVDGSKKGGVKGGRSE
jgi:hypothetical protein